MAKDLSDESCNRTQVIGLYLTDPFNLFEIFGLGEEEFKELLPIRPLSISGM